MSRRDDLARAMLDRQLEGYDTDAATHEAAWADDDVRAFWIAEADFVLAYLAATPAAACEECGNDDPAEGYSLCSDCMERRDAEERAMHELDLIERLDWPDGTG